MSTKTTPALITAPPRDFAVTAGLFDALRERADIALGTGVAAAALALGVPYALGAGFDYDDWSVVAHYYLGAAGRVSFRPAFGLWATPMVWAFGTNAHLYYLASQVVFALASVLLYVALRRLELGRGLALAATLLFVVSPLADGMRLWWTGTENLIALALVLGSIIVGRAWVLDRRRRGRLVVSLLLLGLSVTVYESASVFVLVPVALLPLASAASPSRTLAKAALDVAVTALVLPLTIIENASAKVQVLRPLAQVPARAANLAVGGYTTLVPRQLAGIAAVDLALGAGAGLAVGAAVLLMKPSSRGWREAPAAVRWGLSLFLLGLAVFASWVFLLPANDWYKPTLLGLGNRVNEGAQVFLAVFLAVGATAVARGLARLGRSRALGIGAGVFVVAVLLSSFTRRSLDDIRQFERAAVKRDAVLAAVARALPPPNPGDAVLLGNYNLFSGHQWVPVFAADWDTRGAIRLLYRDRTLLANPVTRGARCDAKGVTDNGARYAWSRLHLVDVGRGVVVTLPRSDACNVGLAALTTRAYPSP